MSVRPAVPDDADAVAAVQAAAWRQTFAGTLPPAVLDQLRGEAAVARWRAAAAEPPSERHRLLVATADGDVVGFAAVGPSGDGDSDSATDAELLAIGVLPDRAGAGHGSRLVNASVDLLSGDGFCSVQVWLTGSDPLGAFLQAAGWAPDGARRSLDLHADGSVVVEQQRLRATIGAP